MFATSQGLPHVGTTGPIALLASCFPLAVPVRVAVTVSGVDAHGRAYAESTSVQLATPSEVLFCSALPFESGDEIHVAAVDGLFTLRAAVVATRYRNGKSAIAARLTEPGVAFPVRRF